MEFRKSRPIYLQIADMVCEQVVSGKLGADDRVPSVRDLGASMGVNPNTVMRTMEYLQREEIVYSRRGMGFFVSDGASQRVHDLQRRRFLDEELPLFVRQMRTLGLSWAEVEKAGETVVTDLGAQEVDPESQVPSTHKPAATELQP
ncbi:MAG: GntR family transcriptional regulator [Bacteroidales bacterium]|nr:GntR family transcriptional regulator [Bacteroidales bacterium]